MTSNVRNPGIEGDRGTLGTWEYDARTDTVTWSPEAERFCGVPAGETDLTAALDWLER